MQTLKLTDENARKFYKTGDPELKGILLDTYGAAFFSEKITDRVQNFNDICRILGNDSNSKRYTEGDADDIAYRQYKDIVKVYNEDQKVDWDNPNQTKYALYFKMGTGFCLRYVIGYFARSSVGSRLCFLNRDNAIDAAKKFLPILKAYYNL